MIIQPERNGYWYAQIHYFRTPGMTMMDLMQIAPLFECEPLDVFSNPAICQQLYGEMKLAVTPLCCMKDRLLACGKWSVFQATRLSMSTA